MKQRYLVRDIDRHGKCRHYVRRPGLPKIRLLAEPGTPAFRAEYERALLSRPPAAPRVPVKQRIERNPERSFIYVAAISPEGPSKVGLTNDPVARVRGLQLGCPGALLLAFLYEVPRKQVHFLEQAIHRRLEKKAWGREWFQMPARDIPRFIAKAADDCRVDILEIPRATIRATCPEICPPE